MPSLAGSDSKARLDTLNTKVYAEQAEWLLNANWADMFEDNADAREAVWKYTEAMEKMDKDNGKKGTSLPEIRAHVYIEKQAEAVTWSDFRDYMRGQDFGFDKRKNMSLTDFFVFVFKLDWKQLADAESFDPAAAARVEAAKAQFAEAQKASDKAKANAEAAQSAAEQAADSLELAETAKEKATEAASAAKTADEKAQSEANAAGEAAEAAETASKKAAASAEAAAQAKTEADEAEAAAKRDAEASQIAADDSEKAAANAQKAADEQAAAEKIVQETMDFIQSQEDAKEKKLAKLKARSENDSLGVVKKGKAFQEYKKLEGEDPMPLQEAKIKQGAQVRKAKKATKAALKKKLKADAAAATAKEAATQAEHTASEAGRSATAAAAKAAEAASDAESAEQEAESAQLTKEQADKSATEAAEAAAEATKAQEHAEKEAAKATEDKHAADAAAEATEKSVQEAMEALNEAEKSLESLKASLNTGGKGTLWLMERDLEEKKKYMPAAKFRAAQRRAKKKMAQLGGAATN